MSQTEIIASNAKSIRNAYPDRTERKARCQHIRKCGGIVGMAINDAIVSAVTGIQDAIDDEGCGAVFAAIPDGAFHTGGPAPRSEAHPMFAPLPRSLVQGTTTNVSADPMHVRAHVATVGAREIDAEVRQTRDSIREGARRTDHRFKL